MNNWNPEEAPIEEITDQEVLAKIAKFDEDYSNRLEAVEFLTDQEALAYVAINDDYSEYICEKAVDRLNDQVLLADVAKKSWDIFIRIAAAEKLNDKSVVQTLYADVAKNYIDHNIHFNKSGSTRMRAAEKLDNQSIAQEVYADIIKDDELFSWEDTHEAFEKLTDQKLLAEIFESVQDNETRLHALRKITNQVLLADIAKHNDTFLKHNPSCNCGACQNHGVHFRMVAAHKLSDQALLTDVAKNSAYGDVRFVVATKLTDDETLDYMANYDVDSAVRQAAYERLTNRIVHDAAIQDSKNMQVHEIIQFAGLDWRILDVIGEKTLILSDKILAKEAYHVKDKSASWENCALRKYLNGSFYEETFSEKEKALIIETRNQNNGNQVFGMDGDNDTLDKVFVLSLEEVVRYFGNSGQIYYGHYNGRRFISDGYNSARKAELGFCEYFKKVFGNQYRPIASTWWLRSPFKDGFDCATAAIVLEDGAINVGGNATFLDEGVRPALWLTLK